jgi:hypothetical protein
VSVARLLYWLPPSHPAGISVITGPTSAGNWRLSTMATLSARLFANTACFPDTAHVPCKFFRQGTCQAGNACPFSHDIGAAAENVCKYFAKVRCQNTPSTHTLSHVAC